MKFRERLIFRVVLGISILVVVITSVTLWQVRKEISRLVIRQLKKQALVFLMGVERQISLQAPDMKRDTLQRITDETVIYSEEELDFVITYLLVVDNELNLLAYNEDPNLGGMEHNRYNILEEAIGRDRAIIPERVSRSPTNIRDGKVFPTIDLAVPIRVEGQVVGGIKLEIDVDSSMPIINERYSSSLNKMFLIVIISASIIITLISFDIRANVTGPIAKLRDVVLKISEGDFRSKVAIKTKNEIGRLGEAFNKMTAMLEAYRKQLTQKIDELSVLNEVGREFASTIEFEKILRLIISKVTEIMQVEAGSLLLIDEDSGDLIFSVVAGEKRKLLEGMRLKMGEGIPGWVAKEGQILLVPDTSKDERFNPEIDRLTGFRTRSVLCVPMKLKAKTIGAIDVINPPQEDFFVGKDITLLKTLADQAAIVINNAKLYRQAQEQLIQLKETQAQLVQAGKLAAVGELAAGVAHELNNPLSSVLLYCQHLLRKLGSEGKIDHDKHPHYLKEIEKAALRGREIVSGLLKFSRQERGDFSDIEVNEVVEDALSLTSYRLEKSNIEVRKELCPDLPRVKGNSNYLQQVVANIILNAIQAMPDGGILGIKTEYDRDIEEVKVFISDTGCGIPDDIKDKIFDPFFTTKKEGTGLGLSISYGIVRDHGGRIEVESKVDSGTTLAVVLPAVGRLQKRRQLKSGKDFSSRG